MSSSVCFADDTQLYTAVDTDDLTDLKKMHLYQWTHDSNSMGVKYEEHNSDLKNRTGLSRVIFSILLLSGLLKKELWSI